MNTMQVGEFKTHFSQVLENVQRGEEVVISYGKKQEKIAVLIPYSNYKKKKRTLGLLKGKIRIPKNFAMTDEEFLNP